MIQTDRKRLRSLVTVLALACLACSLLSLSPALSASESSLAFVYSKTYAKPDKLTAEQRLRIQGLADRIAPNGATPWFAVVRGPGCFSGDSVLVYYKPTVQNMRIRRGESVFIGLTSELGSESVERPIASYAQVPAYGKQFDDQLTVPRLRNIPFLVDHEIADRTVMAVVDEVRKQRKSYRREHLGVLHVEDDGMVLTTGTKSGHSTRVRIGPDGITIIGWGMYAAG